MKKKYILSFSLLLSLISIFLYYGCNKIKLNKKDSNINLYKSYNDSFDLKINIGDYENAIKFGLLALENSIKENNLKNEFKAKMNLACVYDRISDSKKAIKLGNEAMNYFLINKDTLNYGIALNLLSAFYGEEGNIKISKIYALRAIGIFNQYNMLDAELGSAYNQLGNCLIDENKFDSAILFIDLAIKYMIKANRIDQVSGLYLNNSYSCIKLKKSKRARLYLNLAKKIADSLGLKHDLVGIKFRLAELETLNGNFKSAINIFKSANQLRDSLISSENLERISELEVKYNTKKLEFENSKATIKQKNTEILILILILFLFLTFSLIIIIHLKHKRKIQNQKIELENNKIALKEFANILSLKNQQIQDVLKEQKENYINTENKTLNKSDIDEYEMIYNFKILTIEDWETFKRKFNLVYPGFLAGLRSNFIDLTQSEERLILLIKMKLTNQEIAGVLGIGYNSVKKSRQRLRKKLSLLSEVDLDSYIINLNL